MCETGNSRRINPAHGPNALNASQREAKSQSPQEAVAIPPSARASLPKRVKSLGTPDILLFFCPSDDVPIKGERCDLGAINYSQL